VQARRRPREEDWFRDRLARKVRAERAKRRWTQTELAARLGDRVKTRVVRLEQAEAPTTLGQIETLAVAFGMSLVEFLAPVIGVADQDAMALRIEAAREEAVQAVEAEVAGFRNSFGLAYLAGLTGQMGRTIEALQDFGDRLRLIQHEASVDSINRELAWMDRLRAARRRAEQGGRDGDQAR
jgi:transcriptional regulator with XRE-family HTH domain